MPCAFRSITEACSSRRERVVARDLHDAHRYTSLLRGAEPLPIQRERHQSLDGA